MSEDTKALQLRIEKTLEARHGDAAVHEQPVGGYGAPSRSRADAYIGEVTVTAFGDTADESLARLAGTLGIHEDGNVNEEALKLARCFANNDPSIHVMTLSRALLAEHEAHEKTRADAARWKDLAERTVATNEGLCGDVFRSIEDARSARADYDRVETILGVCAECVRGIVNDAPCGRCYGTGIEVAAECARLKRENDALRAAMLEYLAAEAYSAEHDAEDADSGRCTFDEFSTGIDHLKIARGAIEALVMEK